MTKRILVTGATGLVGTELLDQLRARPDVTVVGTSRRGHRSDPGVLRWHIGAEPPPPRLRGPWDVVINAAADVRWSQPAEVAHRANVATVQALRQVVGDRTRLVQISTAYAVGLRGDVASPDPADYRNTYEWSKAAAERLATAAFPDLAIVRPAMVIGRRGDGVATRFTGMYTLVRGIATGTVPAVPAAADARLALVPVDDVARLCLTAALEPVTPATRIRTMGSGVDAPTVPALLDTIVVTLNAWRAARGLAPLVAPRVIAPDSWRRFFRPFARDHLSDRQNRTLDLLGHFEPYLAGTIDVGATHQTMPVGGCVLACLRYWADSNPRLAGATAAPWRGTVAQRGNEPVGTVAQRGNQPVGTGAGR